ncbi:MAG: hypothetical protein M9894_24405 [Planctomycetes bacterium]|nr:hypothetical protein [Planctomycetota bacterium]
MSERTRERIAVDRPRCPYCHEDVGADDEKTACSACMAWHHRACWTEHSACSGCGARESAGAVTSVPVAAHGLRPSALRGDPFSRKEGWFIFAVGASNVLLFGGFLIASLLGGPDLATISVPLLLLGAAFSVWGWRLARPPRASARK